MKLRLAILAAVLTAGFAFIPSPAQDKKKDVIPHGQASVPGPPLSPQEAIKKMQVPPGFHVELVAAEPDIVNPVAMTFDERGRIWITESIEYPKHAAGPGKDRVKLLESTKGDGKFDKITTVIDGLNIPSGIAIGHGGVWAANAPDILFYPFTDFAGAKLGKPQVVVTGFGRHDTHELPNSLTWGPDGWLYGLNGVFNRSVIKQDGKTFDFTCALFKIHPKTKKFEIFCEGTSNPWGLAFNENGDAFVSACVIDHLWHLTETGYYQRQGGPYPPYTWKIGSIVKHRHQKAAYCGLVWFDSDAYPPAYREKLYMGNIHGGAINCDQLEKDGSTYAAKPALSAKPQASARGVGEGSNFLLANDPWFMPVSQKVGPDGCMYILDWYDRYHCYQDAGRDPAGIDRKHGRLYRVVYGDYKAAGKFDLSKEDYQRLVERLKSPNVFDRETAQRLLTEKLWGPFDIVKEAPKLRAHLDLHGLAFDGQADRKARLHALWTMTGLSILDRAHTDKAFVHTDSALRTAAIRGSVPLGINDEERANKIVALAKDASPDVQIQVAIAARKLKGVDPLPVLFDVLTHCGEDKLIPHIVWQNLHPLLEKDGDRFLTLAAKADLAKAPGLAKVLPRAIDRILGNQSGDPAAVVKFIEKLVAQKKTEPAKPCLAGLTTRVQNNEMSPKQIETLKKDFKPSLKKWAGSDDKKDPITFEAALLLAALKERDGIYHTESYFANRELPESDRIRAFDALVTAQPGGAFNGAGVLVLQQGSLDFRGKVLALHAKLDRPQIGRIMLNIYGDVGPELQPKMIELVTQRPAWAKDLFKDIADKKINKDAVNVNQARRLLAMKDAELTKLVTKYWGVPRDSRNPDRERVVAQMKELFIKTPGDAKAGVAVFKKLCAQCHKLYGEGADVGPDITANGRSDFDQLLSNIFDPSLVIGAGYQAVTVTTRQGQSLTGLVVEDNAQRVVLKMQGGEVKTVPRADVEEQVTSKVSLMPEDLEKQLRPQEIVDLLAYLSLDRPPDDAKAKRIPGTPLPGKK